MEYRAAYVGDCRLTSREHANLSDEALLAEAVKWATEKCFIGPEPHQITADQIRIGMWHEMRPDWTDEERRLMLLLCEECGDDCSDPWTVVIGFAANHDHDDISAAAAGDVEALARLRYACGLALF